jgi:predicted RNase H-like nuclease
MQFIGIDGCRGGWVVAQRNNHRQLAFALVTEIASIFAAEDVLVAIDIPIGLPECGSRECDIAARKQLGKGQGSRVFPAPCRAALAGSSYVECCDLNEAASGKRLSKQSHAILPKIRTVDAALSPKLQQHVREAHPEVSFCILIRAPLEHSKKTLAGRVERLDVLRRHNFRFDPVAERLRLGRSLVAVDDLIDAAVCLLTARRISDSTAILLGDGTSDSRGLRMEIIA